MSKKSNLPIEVHDHFRKANILHTYVQKSLGEATKHALETGQELLATKSVIPHGGWETECERLFDGSLRTAQFYMTFAKDFGQLKSAQKSALLMLEGSLDGAAKAARNAVKPPPPKPDPDSDPPDAPKSPETASKPETDSESPPPPKARQRATKKAAGVDYGKCPNCAGTKWDEDEEGVSCSKCHHPHGESTGGPDDDRIKTQRQKTAKTAEALMRAFDDLQVMLAKPGHDEVIKLCKLLLKKAKEWK